MTSNVDKDKVRDNAGALDEQEAGRRKSGEAPTKAHDGDLEPPSSDSAGRPTQPAAGPIPKH